MAGQLGSTGRGTGHGRAHSLALTVHGPLGSVDLLVPVGAVATDVAREYAAQAGLPAIPLIYTELGEPLAPDEPLVDHGVDTGDVLVASTTVHRAPTDGPADSSAKRPRGGQARPQANPGRSSGGGTLAGLLLGVAAAFAVLAGWFAARSGSDRLHDVTVDVLLAGAVLGVLPLGSYRHVRALAAPAFAAAAAFALVAETDQEKLPLVIGITGLAAAVVAAVARALDSGTDAAARVWIATGGGLFVLTSLATLGDLPPRVTWSLLLVLAMLAARTVPAMAVDVPDSFLIDMDRLAITAWSARDRPRSRRGRVVVPESAVVAVAARGSAIITASAAAILVVSGVASPLLLESADLPIDRVGARVLVFLCGAGLLLSARSYRHSAARQLLRLGGLVSWVALSWALVPVLSDGQWLAVGVVAVGLAVLLVLVGVATGRGWRSAWWSRRAEVAEGVVGSFAIAAVVVAGGFFRVLWESTS
jgi:hypothetical protein